MKTEHLLFGWSIELPTYCVVTTDKTGFVAVLLIEQDRLNDMTDLLVLHLTEDKVDIITQSGLMSKITLTTNKSIHLKYNEELMTVMSNSTPMSYITTES